MTFLQSAKNRTTDVRDFLRKAAGGNSIKYKPVKGEKHQIYIPYKVTEVPQEDGTVQTQKSVIAISGSVHEWNDLTGRYNASICLKDVIRNDEQGNVLNDGSCPFCENVGKAWDIYRYRYEKEEAECGKTGIELQNHMKQMKSQFARDRKASDAIPYMYLLVVQFRTNAAANWAPVISANTGLPEYELKVMKMSASRIEKLTQQLENSGIEMEGAEVIFEYPNEDDPRLVVSQSTTAPVFGAKKITEAYAGIMNAINTDVNKFDWVGIEKSFPEWNGMTNAEADKKITELFKAWDEYQLELTTNPNAKYLEYVGKQSNGDNPSLTGGIPAAPQIGAAPGVVAPNAGTQLPGGGVANPGMPGVATGAVGGGFGIPDANAIFGNPGNTPMGNGGINI